MTVRERAASTVPPGRGGALRRPPWPTARSVRASDGVGGIVTALVLVVILGGGGWVVGPNGHTGAMASTPETQVAPRASPGPTDLPQRVPSGPGVPSPSPLAAVVPLWTPRNLVNQSEWTLLEGGSIAQLDNASTQLETISLSVNLTVPTTAYTVALVLNLLTDSGDWFQVAAVNAWPGCGGGWHIATQVWSGLGVAGPVDCNSTIAVVPSDALTLNASVPSATSVCLGAFDATQAGAQVTCRRPPDNGTTGFVTSSIGSPTGYFTGPSTEVLANASSSCPELADAPSVLYTFGPDPSVTAFSPWAYEWGGVNGSVSCIEFSRTPVSVASDDPLAHYVPTLAGTPQSGTHVELVENVTPLDPGSGGRFGTDVAPISFLELTASAARASIGSTVTLNASGTGGTAPYRAVFDLNGTPLGLGPSTLPFTFHGAGTYAFSAYLVDALDTMAGPTPTVNVTIPPLLTLWTVGASPSDAGSDVGVPTRFVVEVTGGAPPLTFHWTGLPSGCPPSNASALACVPAAPGTSWVNVSVKDALGWTATGPGFLFTVVDAPLLHLVASTSRVDVNGTVRLEAQELAGAPSLRYRWSGLPGGCASAPTAVLLCQPTAPGTFAVTVEGTDAFNGTGTALPLPLTVAPALRPSVASNLEVVDAGTPLVLTAQVAGGTEGFQYAWAGLPPGCAPPPEATVTCVPGDPGTIAAAVFITDATGLTAGSASLTIPVYPSLSSRLSVDPAYPAVGEGLRLTAGVVGGAPGTHFAWSGLPQGCASRDTGLLTCTPTSSGSFHVRLVVTDAGGGQVDAAIAVSVAPDSAVALLESPGGQFFVLSLGVSAAAVAAAWTLRRRRFRAATGSRTGASRTRSSGRGTTAVPRPYRPWPGGRWRPSRRRP